MPTANLRTERKTGNLLRSPFTFRSTGQSGIEVSEIFPRWAGTRRHVCHPFDAHRPAQSEPSLFMLNWATRCRAAFDGLVAHLRPGNGEPESTRLCRALPRPSGHWPSLWSSLFCRRSTRALTSIRRKSRRSSSPISATGTPARAKRQNSICWRLNRCTCAEGRILSWRRSIQSVEIAFRMQTEAPEVFDIRRREKTRERYGDGEFGRGCLMARGSSNGASAWCRSISVIASPGTTTTTFECTARWPRRRTRHRRADHGFESAGHVSGHADHDRRRVRAHARGRSQRSGQRAEWARPQQPWLLYAARRRRDQGGHHLWGHRRLRFQGRGKPGSSARSPRHDPAPVGA